MGVTYTTNAGATYEPIATYTAGSAFQTYTFSSIPSTYTDLKLVLMTGRTSSGVNPSFIFRYNGDSGSNYSMKKIRGNSTSPLGNSEANATSINGNYFSMTLDVSTQFVVDIMNYTSTSIHKSSIARSDSPGSGEEITAGTWRSTSAITSLTITNDGGGSYLLAGTTATLYGIKAA